MSGFSIGINYGCDRVRFPSLVKVGDRGGVGVKVDDVSDVPGGAQVTATFAPSGRQLQVSRVSARRHIRTAIALSAGR